MVVAQMALALALSAVLGFLAARVGVPLAWVLGPMVATAALSLAGLSIFAPQRGRQFGQLIVGTAIGLNVTAGALGQILYWFPAMLVTAVVSMLTAALLSVPYARASRVDQTTAFFSLTPGGLSEMANVGHSEGAQPEPIALAQAIRVALVVFLMPPLILAFGLDGGIESTVAGGTADLLEVTVVFAVGLACVFAFIGLRANNPWMVGALVGGGIVAGLELVDGRMPPALFILGQFLIGVTIGARFKRESLRRLPRVGIMTVIFVILLGIALFGYALLLWLATGIDLSSTTLASSPGGLAEMVLTAQALHLNVALVTAFHIVRSFFVNAFTQHAFHLFRKVGLFRLAEAVLNRIWRP